MEKEHHGVDQKSHIQEPDLYQNKSLAMGGARGIFGSKSSSKYEQSSIQILAAVMNRPAV